ncbi:MAG: protein-L-isoaspartate(D-aspartate) O-methyltransferase [Nitrospirae bacterium]|nr:protein-L-isoaspartate(D-aspartate) O-methyltransferase [Nitrospirota bacterium]
MIHSQLISRGITDKFVLDAMDKVPRHLFVPLDLQEEAYDDRALPIGENQTISQPYMVALMTELLSLNNNCTVLEIGTGSGYQAAILAHIAFKVYTIERIPTLLQEAEKRFIDLRYNNIFTKLGDGSKGWGEGLLFDRIIITAAAPSVPQVIINQLADPGIIVAPVGERYSQSLVIITKDTKKYGNTLNTQYQTPCIFVPLIGKYGWSD